MAKKKPNDKSTKKRKSLLASLFEPAEQSETEISFGEFEPDEAELDHVFDGEIPDLFDDVPTDTSREDAILSEEPKRAQSFRRRSAKAAGTDDAPRRRRLQADTVPMEVAEPDTASVPEEESRVPVVPTDAEQPEDSTREEIADTDGTSGESGPVPAGEKASSPAVMDQPSVSSDTADAQPSVQPGRAKPSLSDFLARGREQASPASQAISLKGDGQPEAAPSSGTAAGGEAASPVSTGQAPAPSGDASSPSDGEAGAATVQAPGAAQQEAEPADTEQSSTADADTEEPIRLFDDGEEDEEPAPGPRRTHRHTVRTKDGTRMQVVFHETETYRSVEAARERQRAVSEKARRAREAQKAKRKKKRRRTAKRMAMNAAIAGIAGIIVLALGFFLFRLSDILVTGNEQYSSDYVIELSGLKLGRHMLFCDLDAAKTGIEQDPYLQVDSVDYLFPSRVRIKVTERKEVAALVGLDYNVIIDHSGYVLSMSGGTDVSGLVQVSGVSMSGFQVGQRLGQSDDFSTATLLSIINALEDYMLLDDIASIDMTTPLAITLTARNGIKIFVGQSTDLADKMATLYQLLPRFTQNGITSGTLYLSAKGGAVYSPQGSAEAAQASVTGTTTDDTYVEGYVEGYGDVTTQETTDTQQVTTQDATGGTQAGAEDGFQG